MLKSKFNILPDFFTKRMILRRMIDDDASALFNLRNNNIVNRYIDRAKEITKEDAVAFIKRINAGINECQWLYWAICPKESNQLIGTACLWNYSNIKNSIEIGYELLPEFFGQGIMSEVIECLLDYAFTVLEINEIEAFTHEENESSIALLSKFNFKYMPGRLDTENIYNRIYVLRFKDYKKNSDYL